MLSLMAADLNRKYYETIYARKINDVEYVKIIQINGQCNYP